jgi:hypothetical protein
MSHLFQTKELDGSPVKFLRFDGPERFIVQVNGVEQSMSRQQWTSLPEQKTSSEIVNQFAVHSKMAG